MVSARVTTLCILLTGCVGVATDPFEPSDARAVDEDSGTIVGGHDGSIQADDDGGVDAGHALDAGEEPSLDGGVVCPTQAPFDDTNPDVVAACTRPIAVAAGNALRRASSFDGITWANQFSMPNSNPDQNENSHRDIAIAKGVIVIVGDGGLLASVDRGVTYSVIIKNGMHDSTIAYFKGRFWVVSNYGTLSSADGVTWDQQWLGSAMLPGNLEASFSGTSSATDGQLLFVISWRTTSYRLFDGSTWSEHDFGSSFASLSSARFGNGRFVVTGWQCCGTDAFAGLRAASTDHAQHFQLVTNATAGATEVRFGDVVFANNIFFATSTQYDTHTYTSTDGLSWAAVATNQAIGPVTWHENAYLGANDTNLFRSTDGVQWTNVDKSTDTWGYVRIVSGRVLR